MRSLTFPMPSTRSRRQLQSCCMLNDLGGEFDNFREDELGIFDDNNPLNGSPYVTEPIRPSAAAESAKA